MYRQCVIDCDCGVYLVGVWFLIILLVVVLRSTDFDRK